MQNFRGNLTRLRSLMEQKLPDGHDIYGYSGYNKAMLLAAVDTAYALSQEIKGDLESRFEVLSLKRAGSEVYQVLKEFLESEETDQEKKRLFNGFLNSLSELIEKTKMTYFIVAKGGMYEEEELLRINTRIEALTILATELEEQSARAVSSREKIESLGQELDQHQAKAAEILEQLEEWEEGAERHQTSLAEAYEKVAGWDEAIKECEAEYQALRKRMRDLTAETDSNAERLQIYEKEGKKQIDNLSRAEQDHSELLEQIKLSLGDANRVGMAASFIRRKDELHGQQLIWASAFCAAMAGLLYIVTILVLPTLSAMHSEGDNRWLQLFVELGAASPFIWLGWFAAKQYGYTSRIREDYAFKSAAAMAYEGHKKAARETDGELEKALLALSLANMSQNPIRIYGDAKVHGTPFHELLEGVLAKFSFGRLKAKTSVGELELSALKPSASDPF